jgi:hypothetical protein
VLAVSCDHRVPAGAGHAIRADKLAARLPARAWQRLSTGKGAKGHRCYDWAWITISDPGPGCRWLLIRRNRRTRERAFYRCYAAQPVPLAALVKVAGLRWTTEENLQAGKGLTGLDEHQARTRHLAPDALVQLAATPPAPRPDMPLPAAGNPGTMKITIYGWSAGRGSPPTPPRFSARG